MGNENDELLKLTSYVQISKYREKTLKFLQNTKLDNFTYNKALQKIAESYRVDKVTKEEIKKMKRK